MVHILPDSLASKSSEIETEIPFFRIQSNFHLLQSCVEEHHMNGDENVDAVLHATNTNAKICANSRTIKNQSQNNKVFQVAGNFCGLIGLFCTLVTTTNTKLLMANSGRNINFFIPQYGNIDSESAKSILIFLLKNLSELGWRLKTAMDLILAPKNPVRPLALPDRPSHAQALAFVQ